LLDLYSRKLICLVELSIGPTSATADSCECTADGRTCNGTNTAQQDLEADALIERGKHANRRSKQDEKNKNGLTHSSLLKTQGTRHLSWFNWSVLRSTT